MLRSSPELFTLENNKVFGSKYPDDWDRYQVNMPDKIFVTLRFCLGVENDFC